MLSAKISFKRWYRRTGEPAPLRFVPEVLHVPATEVAQAVRDGKLRVLTFTADDGRVLRFVPWSDLNRFGKNPLTERSMHIAFRRLMAA